MTSRRFLLAAALLLTLSRSAEALAAGSSNPAPVQVCGGSAANCLGSGSDGTFTGVGNGSSDDSNGVGPTVGTSSGGQPAILSDTYVLSDYVPTCTANNALDSGVLCGAAMGTCLPRNTGLIRYWRYDATYVRATKQPQGPPVRAPGTFCLGPNTPRVSPVAAIAGVVASEFQDLVVLKGEAVVSPAGTTLVNYDNGYYTNAARYVLDPVQILGHAVVVTAIPKSYDWYFGDGTSALDAGPGARGTKDVHHTYQDTGGVAAHVVITWTGTFTVDGGAPITVFGTAQTTGPGTPLQVKQARAELVTK